MKLFTTKQIAELDQYTIVNEPIADIDLMERASLQITNWLIQKYSTERKMLFFAGPGNNGGDALAIARQMADLDYSCELFLLEFGKGLKGSPAINMDRVTEQGKVQIHKVESLNDFPKTTAGDVLIDGLFGSGLTRPLEGLPGELVRKINASEREIVAIDIPSGLMGEDNTDNNPEHIIRASYTLTFQFPKISFLFPENEKYVGSWAVLPIGLHPDGISSVHSDFHFVQEEDVRKMMPLRSKFDHKGIFGHALLIAGSYGKMGASVLASKGCLRAGAGLLTSHVPRMGYTIIQTAVPEAMVSVDQHDSMFTDFPDLTVFTAIGTGPGLDQKQNSCRALCRLLDEVKVPVVLDADAVNILSKNQEWLDKLPENSILTPHPGEFRRLVGSTENSFASLQKQIEFSKRHKVILVLKGAHTSISLPNGKVFFNSTGNPGMATAGSGDVLTGIVLGFLAQGMNPFDAAITAVYLHGRAGDVAARDKSEISLVAGDILESFGRAVLELQE